MDKCYGKGGGEVRRARRSDYVLDLDVVRNGRRPPIETYRFYEVLRMWREESWDSKVIID